MDSFLCISLRSQLSSSVLFPSFVIPTICRPAPVKSSLSLISPLARWWTWLVSITFHFPSSPSLHLKPGGISFSSQYGSLFVKSHLCMTHKMRVLEAQKGGKEFQNASLQILSRWHWLRKKKKKKEREEQKKKPRTKIHLCLHCAVKSYVTGADFQALFFCN